MKTITIYELLGLVKDGKAPKKIIGKNSMGKKEIYIYNGFWYICIFENPDGEEDYYYMNRDISNLNDEVEIIEEEKKIPERVPNAKVFEVPKLNNIELSNIALTNKEDIGIIKDTLNKVLDYLKSKGE